jgi:malonyl-CoA decarboxylase
MPPFAQTWQNEVLLRETESSSMANSFLNDLLQTLTHRGRGLLGLPGGAAATENLAQLGEQLLSGRGEASGVALAGVLLATYAAAPAKSRLGFLTALAERFGADPVRVEQAIDAYRQAPGQSTLHALHLAAEPPRQELMRRLNLAPGGTAALVRIREELLGHLDGLPALQAVDDDFVHLFTSWFNRGFLVLRPIDWTTPANILEKIIRYEAVHRIRGWDDLRRRLEPADRRCFAFFHPQLVDEPLIFVEVALTREMPDAIAPLLSADRLPIPAEEATTAVFYSISNTQRGLAGVSFGNFLIKQVVEDLQRSLPGLKSFVTLSPVPGFAAWLARERADESSALSGMKDKAALAQLDDPAWPEDPVKTEALRQPLLHAAAHYFLNAKIASGLPADSVARFHLRNGARLERINFLADVSRRGLDQAHGLMTNYLYDLDQIERNHEAFAAEGKLIAAPSVRKLLRQPPPGRRRG